MMRGIFLIICRGDTLYMFKNDIASVPLLEIELGLKAAALLTPQETGFILDYQDNGKWKTQTFWCADEEDAAGWIDALLAAGVKSKFKL
eukprot:m.31493 g.31493  ORF g.31493 m.31493 type:complete len:89 (-) comp10690_c0_seq2:2381-2647(-)